jgi:Fic family protein
LIARGVLKEPILYLSLYFKTHRAAYYQLLQCVRDEGDWEAWLDFFLRGVTESSTQATETAAELLRLFEADAARIEQLGRAAASALRVHQALQQRPFIAVADGTRRLGLSAPTIRKSITHLEELGIVHEVTGRQRDRVFAYRDYMTILNRGTEPLDR